MSNNNKIESSAVSALKDVLINCGIAMPFISENDKEPCFDGHIYIYNNKDQKRRFKWKN